MLVFVEPKLGTTNKPPLILKSQILFIPDASSLPARFKVPPEMLIDPPLEPRSSFAAFPIFKIPFVTFKSPNNKMPAPVLTVKLGEFRNKPVLAGRVTEAV